MPFKGTVFPGQGTQRRGMAMDFYDNFQEARQIFTRASGALSLDIEKTCREEDPKLNRTEFTQPCILAAEIAMFESLKAHHAFEPEYFGGHSLGEYTALVAAGAIPFEFAIRLVHIRGKLMQWSMKNGTGNMAAVIMDKLPHTEVDQLANAADVDVANDNSVNQVVLSGDAACLDKLCADLQLRYCDSGVRVVPLTVSAPFHSRHMKEIEGVFGKILLANKSQFDAEKAKKVTSNYTGKFHTGDLDDLLTALTRQISGRVRWRDNMNLLSDAADEICEIGPNRPLSGFFKTIGVQVPAVIDMRTAQRAFAPKPPAQPLMPNLLAERPANVLPV